MESDVERLLDRIEDAYKHHDARALAGLYHPNARYPLPTGGVATGREEIQEHLPAIFALVPEDIEIETISRQIDLVTANLAIVDLRVQNYRRVNGDREPVSVEGFTIVVTREDDQWLIAGLRGALVPKA